MLCFPVDDEPVIKRPLAAVLVAGFFAYAGVVPLLFMVLGSELVKLQQQQLLQQSAPEQIPQPVSVPTPQPVSIFAGILISLTVLGCIALLIPGRARIVFQYSRVVLGAWLLTAFLGFFGPVGMPMTADFATPGRHTPSLLLLLFSTALVGALFYFFSFGRACRIYYGLPVEPQAREA